MPIKKERVLVVDDEEIEREILKDRLTDLGITVVYTADDGITALEQIESHEDITLVLLDIIMPGMNGPECMARISRLKHKPRIILISSIDIDALKSIAITGRALGLDVSGIMKKPIDPDILKTRIEKGCKDPAVAKKEINQPDDIDIQMLMDAIGKGEIIPWYQPKVDITDHTLIGVEALARWQKADGSMISPGALIPAIELYGLSDMLFYSMLEKVFQDMHDWNRQGQTFTASVNMTIDCATNATLPDTLSGLLKKHRIDPADIIIEVTESRIANDAVIVNENLGKIAEMGIMLSIDDFGTGYSSLSQVASLPFGELKIDGSFVQQAGKNSKADAILQSTITLGRSLGMKLVAEGVESHEQMDLISEMGAEIVQGFLMARPMPSKDFNHWLLNWRPGMKKRPGCDRPISILIVDDDRSIRLFLEALFAEKIKGAKIYTAESGEQAEQMMKNVQIDAATLDFHMPGVNGIDLLRLLRNIQPVTRFVMSTSDTREEIAREATKLGALYCPKPLTDFQIDRIIRYFEF